jgi:hypothetical protein
MTWQTRKSVYPHGIILYQPGERVLTHPTTTITPGSSNRQDMRLWTVESGFESLPRNF